jgi:enamine deaminase RidA (YjgF/YER057c/UK114 family)
VSQDLFAGVPYDYAAVAPAGTVFTAGACPLDREGQVVAPGDHEAQARVAVANLRTALEAAGADLRDLVKTTVYVVAREREDLVRVWRVVEAALAPARPPSTLLGVTFLGYPEQLVEIEGVASTAGPSASRAPERTARGDP